jgi:glycine cleavage system aminomethyltransferase T
VEDNVTAGARAGTGARRHRLYPAVRRSPYFARTEQQGAVDYMVYNHMYMPMSYGRDPGEDYRALTQRVTLWDVGAERQTQLQGPDAFALADYVTTRDLRELAPLECRYTLCCDETGQIICDPVLIAPASDLVWLSHGTVDLTLWVKAIALHTDFDVEVSEPDVAPLQLQGPRSLEVLHEIVGAAIDELAPFRCLNTRIAGADVVVSRTGWSGGLGYEIFPLGSEKALAIWDAIVEAGASYGILVTAPNVPKAVEAGITDTSLATNQRLTPLELWQDYLVDFGKGSFIGKEALLAAQAEGARRKMVGLVGGGGPFPLQEGFWDVLRDGKRIGATRWAVSSLALDRNLAIAVVGIEHAEPGTAVEVVHPRGTEPMEVTTLPFRRGS